MIYAFIFLAFLLGAGVAFGSLLTGYHYGWYSAKGSDPQKTFLREYRSGVPKN